MSSDLKQVPGFLFFDHVAISVKPGELEAHVQAYRARVIPGRCRCGPEGRESKRQRCNVMGA